MEQTLSTGNSVYDPDMGAGNGNWNMTDLAGFLSLQTIFGKRNTFSTQKEAYSDTTNIAGKTVPLDLKGIIDWTDLALEELEKVYEECLEANWDGYGAMPISRETYSKARKLLRMIPPSLPRPDISTEPDGEIIFEWYKKKYFVFVISVGGNNLITYAGLFGKSNKIHGTEYFADELPEIIHHCIRRLSHRVV
ncbi:MAG: hypothetical protein LWX02_06480 [Deltaproteobacteria bacterium]|jgi:hypothetical protein|nr:hypothetical protein [Deltaproteobacteria bacterium]MDL1986446.1 hypothetical protein [Deltaproteobacteria bacterium]